MGKARLSADPLLYALIDVTIEKIDLQMVAIINVLITMLAIWLLIVMYRLSFKNCYIDCNFDVISKGNVPSSI